MPNIHLIRTPELPFDFLTQVQELLSSFPGPMTFIASEYSFNVNQFPFLKKYRENFEFEKVKKEKKIDFNIDLGNPLSWRELFSLCNFYRETFSIPKDDFVFLITKRKNGLNWFSHVLPSRDAFVHADDWAYFTKVSPVYPVAYQVVENTLQCLMNLEMDIATENIHDKPLGCMNDFCGEKGDIILKLQTGNICESCIERLRTEEVPDNIVIQALDIFDGIRKQFIFRSHTRLKHTPKKLEVTPHGRFLIPELGQLELSFPTKERTLYLFFLLKEYGVRRADLSDHTDNLLRIYSRLSGNDNLKAQETVINNLVSLQQGRFNEAKSRINSEVKAKLHPGLEEYYKISGSKNEIYKIELPRDLLSNHLDIRF